ncbi:hypothetical protein BX070DRAFT_33086 [Coemansia spiralis]|nr:hypothetical protein BX070DRAFT_33086 [Coemansia spiralis]
MRTTTFEVELQRAKDVLESCDLVSPSTKGCYSSRIALWMHYCTVCCNGDEEVTEQRLADYVEWMVSSGSAERIRQGTTHIQQVLRNQLQGVLCYWRIQHGNRPDLTDPRLGPIFMAKWQQIVMRYPRSRHSRRSEPIYGVQRSPVSIEPIKTEPIIAPAVSGTPHPAHAPIRPSHIMPNGGPPGLHRVSSTSSASGPSIPSATVQYPGSHSHYRPHPSQISQRQQSPHQDSPAHYPQGLPQRSWIQSPYDDHTRPGQHSPPAKPLSAAPPAPYPSGLGASRVMPPGPPGVPKYPHDQTAYRHPQKAIAEKISSPASGVSYPNKPSNYLPPIQSSSSPLSNQRQYPPAPLPQQRMPMHMAGRPIIHNSESPSSITAASPVASASKQDPAISRMSVDSEEGINSTSSNRVPDNTDMSHTASENATAVPSSPKVLISQYALEGIVPEDIPQWTTEDANDSAAAPEGYLLNQNETIALSIRQLGVRPGLQLQARAHVLLGLSSWMSASSRTMLTLGDIWTEEPSDIAVPTIEPVNSAVALPEEKEPEQHIEAVAGDDTSDNSDNQDKMQVDQEKMSDKDQKDSEQEEQPKSQQESNDAEVLDKRPEPSPQPSVSEQEKQLENTEQEQDQGQDQDRDHEMQSPSGGQLDVGSQEKEQSEQPEEPQPESKVQEDYRQQDPLPTQPLRVLSIALRTPANRTGASANERVS